MKNKSFISTIILFFVLYTNVWSQTTYYVDNQNTSASDSNAGTQEQPFQTISKALQTVGTGDVILISEGVYREKLGGFKSSITLQAEEGEKVVLTGFDEVIENQNGVGTWTQHAGNVWKIQLTAAYNLEPETLPAASGNDPIGKGIGQNMVLIDDVKQNEARWPNTNNSTLLERGTKEELKDVAISTGGDFNGVVSGERYACWYDTEGISGDWTGGYIQFVSGHEWWGQWGYITASTANRVDFEFNTSSANNRIYNRPYDNDPFFIWGKLHALDFEKEFFIDTYGDEGAAHTLYIYGNPTGKKVEVRTRDVIVQIINASDVTFKDITFVGGVIRVEETSPNVTFDNVEARLCGRHQLNRVWVSPAFILKGENNKLINSKIYDIPGSSISVSGANANNVLIENNVIYNTGYLLCSGNGTQIIGGAKGTNIFKNTVYNTSSIGIGASGLAGGNVKFNRVYKYGYQTTDVSGINAWNGGNADGGEIAYNIVHDAVAYNATTGNTAEPQHFGGKGIRLDAGGAPNGNFNFNIHHNIVYNTTSHSITIWPNSDAQRTTSGLSVGQVDGNKVFNNTFDNNIFTRDELVNETPETGQYYKGTEFFNNIALGRFFYKTGNPNPPGTIIEDNLLIGNVDNLSITNNLTGETDFVDETNGDFRLQSTSQAIDAGREIPPYTDGYEGTAPDMGALENGKIPFVSGAVLREQDLDSLVVNCVVDENGILNCTFDGLPLGRQIPDDFVIKVGEQSISGTCLSIYNNDTHMATSVCDLGNTQISENTIEVSLDGNTFTEVNVVEGDGGEQTLLNQLNPINIITPNGDGQNDTWQIENLELIQGLEYNIKVFTKTGQIVFDTDDYQQNWAATYDNGSPLQEGVYYYIISVDSSDSHKTGYITVIN